MRRRKQFTDYVKFSLQYNKLCYILCDFAVD